MASQIAHIIYCQKYLSRIKENNFYDAPDLATRKNLLDNKDEFMLGSVFPDIRRIAPELKRSDTHLCYDPIDLNFTGMSAFNAGWKFHLYADMKREEILGKYKFYSFDKTADFWHIPSKLLEDEIVYSQYDNWEKLVNYFNNPPYLNQLVSRETFLLWYAINARYMEKKPNSKSMGIFISKLPKLAGAAVDIVEIVDDLRNNKKILEILKKVTEEIV